MIVECKIIVTWLSLWFVLFMAAYPGTKFADWGERMMGGYAAFLQLLCFILLVPVLITGLVIIWRL